jgi:hypothetical protein
MVKEWVSGNILNCGIALFAIDNPSSVTFASGKAENHLDAPYLWVSS